MHFPNVTHDHGFKYVNMKWNASELSQSSSLPKTFGIGKVKRNRFVKR